MCIEIRDKVRMRHKILSMFESTGADICHLVVLSTYMKGYDRGCLSGPLPKGEKAKKTGRRDGGGGATLFSPTDR